MEVLALWLTPALLVALFAWLRRDVGGMRRELNGRSDKTDKRIDDLGRDVAKRFDQRSIASWRISASAWRSWKARSLEGFLAGRRDRDVA